MLKMPEKMKGKRIVLLRPYPPTFELAKEIFEKVDLSRKTWRNWLPWVDNTKTPEDEFSHWLVNWAQQHWNENKGFAYLIRHKKTNEILGAIDLLRYIEENRSAEIGYWLSDDAVGHGYMTEAVRVLESAAFKRGLNRIVIANDTENIKSANVPKRCGYHLDGIMRQEQWSEELHSFRDMNVWSKLKSEWAQEQKPKNK